MILPPQIVMIAWLPIIFYLFAKLKSSEAVVVGFIVAWLFLPQDAGFSFPGLPDYERISATVYGIFLATIIYDFKRIGQFNFNWIDLPMTVWCICPLFSSINNGLGVYDGIASSVAQTVAYGGPYFLGRIYLNNIVSLRKLAIGIFIGGLVYAPLCLYEVRFSPQLHKMVYGYHGIRSFAQSIRYGGFRPTVFMRHGLSVGMWMMAATLIGICFWKTGIITRIFNVHIRWLVCLLIVTFVLVKATGAYALLLLGIICLLFAWQFKSVICLIVINLAIVFYLHQSVSPSSQLSNKIITNLSTIAPEERLLSLQFRFENEELLKARARERIIFGWGGYNRNRVFDYNWRGDLVDISTTDSLWILAFGKFGIVGLISVFSSMLVPVLTFCYMYFTPRNWSNANLSTILVLSTIVTLYMIDCLLNNQFNPIFVLVTGGISGFIVKTSGS